MRNDRNSAWKWFAAPLDWMRGVTRAVIRMGDAAFRAEAPSAEQVWREYAQLAKKHFGKHGYSVCTAPGAISGEVELVVSKEGSALHVHSMFIEKADHPRVIAHQPLMHLMEADGRQWSVPSCPVCRGITVMRLATTGFRKGLTFYGCVSWDKCSGVVNIDPLSP